MASPGKIARIAVKFILIALAVVMLVGFLLLKWMERAPAQLKVGFESYLTQLSGYPVDIGVLKNVSFVPHMAVDMADVRFWALDDPNRTMIGVRDAAIHMPLWSVLLGMPRFSALSIEGVTVEEEVTGIAPITLEHLFIDADDEMMKARGTIGAMTLEGGVPLEQAGRTFKTKSPPTRLTIALKGPKTQGDVFIDVNVHSYGVTGDFSHYAAQDMRPIQLLLERFLASRHAEGALPVHLHMGALEGRGGPYNIPALIIEEGVLQPPECFYNNQGRAGANPHPCAQYFETPDADNIP